MSLLWFEGFDYCTTIAEYRSNRWLSAPTSVAGQGRYDGGRAGSWGGGAVETIGVPSASTYVIGFAWKQSGQTSNTDRYLINFLELPSTSHIRLSTGNGITATPQVTRGDGTLLGNCTMDPLANDIWYYVEMKVVIHDSAGSVEVRFSGETVLSLSGIDTRNGGTGQVDAIQIRGDFTAYYDDMWIDTANFLGDCKVETLSPTGAGNSTDFTPSAGSNWQNVDDTVPNGDTDYNTSATVGDKDTFAMGNLATAAGSVLGIQSRVRARKDDAGARVMRSLVRTGGSDFESGDHALSDSYRGYTDLRTTNPDTTAAWTISEVNALEAGYKVEA